MRMEGILSGTDSYNNSTTNVQGRTEAAKTNTQEKANGQTGNTNTQDTIQKQIDEHEVIQAIEKANKHIKTFDRKLEFSIHESTKQIMVKVINTDDNTVIREIPSEKILDMVAHMWEVAGILVDEKR